MSIGILFALKMEAEPFRKLVDGHSAGSDGLHIGNVGGHDVVFAFSGMGNQRATSSALQLISAQKPSILISAGMAGALCEGLISGDGVVCRTIIDASSAPCSAYDVDPTLFSTAAEVDGVKGYDRNLVTAGAIASLPSEKLELGRKFDAVAVDMESGPIARVARAFDVPFISIRAIVDSVDDVIPSSLSGLVAEDGSIMLSAILIALVSHPRIIPQAIALKSRSTKAVEHLARILATFIERVPDSYR